MPACLPSTPCLPCLPVLPLCCLPSLSAYPGLLAYRGMRGWPGLHALLRLPVCLSLHAWYTCLACLSAWYDPTELSDLVRPLCAILSGLNFMS